MRLLLAVAALGALTTAAVAAPWANNEVHFDDDSSAYIAYQFSSASGDYTLEYECDSGWQLDTFTVQTAEAYDQAASYPTSVPTQFIVDDGAPVELTGVFQDRSGYLVAFYESYDAFDEYGAVLDAIEAAKSSIRVKFLDHDVAFSAEGVSEALAVATVPCYS